MTMRAKKKRGSTKPTAKYAEVFRRLTSQGWTLRNYGGGWRYFTRLIPDAPAVQPPSSQPGSPATMRLFERCRANNAGTKIEPMEPQHIA